jgi:hypothetical protein
MSIFGSIMGKIFGHPSASAQEASAVPGAGAAGSAPPPPMTPPAGGGTVPGGMPPGTAPAAAPAAPAAAPMQSVDVQAVLTEMASRNGQSLNWKQSIVDLMKLLGLDSSLDARKDLAHELNYSGDTNDSASMNIWLHKQVMTRLAENGGQVPPELKG